MSHTSRARRRLKFSPWRRIGLSPTRKFPVIPAPSSKLETGPWIQVLQLQTGAWWNLEEG